MYTLPKANMASFKLPMFNRKYIFKGSIFHCYVSLSECSQTYTLPETSSSHLKSGWLEDDRFLLGFGLFSDPLAPLFWSGSFSANFWGEKKSRLGGICPLNKNGCQQLMSCVTKTYPGSPVDQTKNSLWGLSIWRIPYQGAKFSLWISWVHPGRLTAGT